jgi:hypothetical protein
MRVKISQRTGLEGAGTPLAVHSISCDVIVHVGCRLFCVVNVTRAAGTPHVFPFPLLQGCSKLLLHFVVFVLL